MTDVTFLGVLQLQTAPLDIHDSERQENSPVLQVYYLPTRFDYWKFLQSLQQNAWDWIWTNDLLRMKELL